MAVTNEFCGSVSSTENKYDLYIVLVEYLKRLKEFEENLANDIMTVMEDSGIANAKCNRGVVTLVESQRLVVSGSDLADRASEAMHALNVHMLLDTVRAATTIRTNLLSSNYMKQLASDVAVNKTYKYLKARKK